MAKTYFLSLLLLLIAISLSIFPDIYHQKIAPPGTTFPLIHNYPEDYFSYLSYMRQGYEGNWLISPRYNSQAAPRVLLFTFFSFLGHLSKLSNLSLPLTYFLSRIVFALLLYLLLFYLCTLIFSQKIYRLTSFALILFSTGFWSLDLSKNSVANFLTILPIKEPLAFWTHFDPIVRTTFLPHHLFSLILGLSSLLLFLTALKKQSITRLLLSGFLSLISTFIFYQVMINILAGIFIGLIFISLKKLLSEKSTKNDSFILPDLKIAFLFFLVFALITSISLVYLLYIQTHVFPWTNVKNIGTRFFYHFTILDYLSGLGPTFLLTLIGLPLILAMESPLIYILLGWVIAPFIGLFLLSPLFPHFGNTAFLEATSYIPLALLSPFGLKFLSLRLKNRLLITALYPLLFLYFLPALVTSLQQQLILFPTTNYNRYLPNDVISGLNFLNSHTPSNSVVISGGFFGNIIPAYSHNRVVYGDEELTANPGETHTDTIIFFSGGDIPKAAAILKKYHVSFVFYSLDTDLPKDEFIKGLNLIKIYDNPKVKIFKTAQTS